MKRLLAVLATVLALGVGAAAPAARPAADPAVAADVRMLAAEMERLHPDLFHTLPRADFRRAVDDLLGRLPQLERDQLLVELMRLVALPGPRNGHMGLWPLASAHRRPLHIFPVRLWAFEDGFFVVRAPTMPELVGSRLVAIDGSPLEDVAARVRPLVPHDNDSTVLLHLPEFLVTAEVLHGLGVIADAGSARLGLVRPGGERTDVSVRAMAGPAYLGGIGDYWAPTPPPSAPTPLWLRNRERTQWFATLDRGRVVYAAYSMTTHPTSDFADRLLRRARQPKVRRVIVDVRLNGGGDNTTYSPLVRVLRDRAVNRSGRLVLLTGRVTFSAAGNFVAEVEAATRARIVGEAPGGSPHNYGETVEVELRTLGWTVSVPVQYVQVLGRPDERVAIEPDVAVAVRAADHFAGRDPVLAKAIGLGASQALSPGLFAYDASAPLDVREGPAREVAGARVIELTYRSPKGGRVPATLVLPSAEGRHPAVVFQHGAGDARRSDFQAEAEDLARAGVASLLVDAPFNRPPFRPWLTFQPRDRAAYVQNVIDLRRAIDLLEARPEIDGERLALVGFSYGGVLAGIVAGLERRLDAVVVMSGPGRITDALAREGRRQGVPAKRLARYVAAMRAVDAVPYVGRATATILFQFGRQDDMPRAWFRKYIAAAGPKKQVEWYPAGHGLCDCATRDRRGWLLQQLG